ncbi:MAG: NlpC/P60 family protein [Catonella sp.]|nr:NlpC/P60 family protein [Catonella sp.]MDY6356925.1 NlpC/P60 family protein [Catonella sp.]
MNNKNFFEKFGYGLCIATAAAALFSETAPTGVKASSFTKSSGLAGISLAMDSFYGDSETDTNVVTAELDSVVPVDEVLSSSVVSDSAIDSALGLTASDDATVSEAAVAAGSPLLTTDGTVSDETASDIVTPDDSASSSAVTTDSASSDGDDEDTSNAKDAVPDEDENEVVSKYQNIGISIADPYVNIRQKPSTEAKIVAKLYKGSKCDILSTKNGWVKIKSGNAKGYIKEEYLARGFDAEDLIDTYGTKYAVVQTETLNVRFEPNTDSRIATQVPEGEKLLVTKAKKGWYEISIDNGAITGWVSKDYVKIKIAWKHAITIAEEKAEAERKAAAEAALAAQQSAYNAAVSQSSYSQSSYSQSSSSSNSNSGSSSKSTSTVVADSGSYSGSGSSIANFACKFVGNPYVWGGTSLTNGADCSGFVKSVYANFGYSLPHHSGSQAGCGTSVSLSSLQPGDLVFYAANGYSISHVAIYIGGGKVVHASTPQTGITISSVNHMTPYCARRIVK